MEAASQYCWCRETSQYHWYRQLWSTLSGWLPASFCTNWLSSLLRDGPSPTPALQPFFVLTGVLHFSPGHRFHNLNQSMYGKRLSPCEEGCFTLIILSFHVAYSRYFSFWGNFLFHERFYSLMEALIHWQELGYFGFDELYVLFKSISLPCMEVHLAEQST